MELKVKPILTYEIPKRREKTSWRNWGGLQTEEDSEKELQKIEEELEDLASSTPFPLEVSSCSPLKVEGLPEMGRSKTSELSEIRKELSSSDVALIYAAGGGRDILESLVSSSKWSLIFVRHESGLTYKWYETIHPRLLRKGSDEFLQPRIGVGDIVVDDYEEVLWRLRALYGLKNTVGKRVVSIGPPGGWETGTPAVTLAEDKWGIDVETFPYQKLADRIEEAKDDETMVTKAQREAENYLSRNGISLNTNKGFVVNAFMLYHIFKELMEEFETDAITIVECMSTVMPLAETTACLPLSLINDENSLAFCESDFVVIPSGILLHYITGEPVFLNDPTYPHDGKVTLAHCTSPTRLSGDNYEDAEITTHFESDYGAAPKVEFSKGQEVTVVVPDFRERTWLGFKGEILDSPDFQICRSQVEVKIEGDWKKLLREMKGFHWMMCYGDYLKEIGYALKKKEVEWLTI